MAVRKKKVLIVCYYFPPSGGPGVQRVLKFLPQLIKLNWQPLILTVKENAEFFVRDESLLASVPDSVTVKRTGIFEPYTFYRKMTGKKTGDFLDGMTLSLSERQHKSFAEKISLFLRSWLFIPDARIGWLWPAVLAGLRVIRQQRPDVILTSGPPNTTHLIGLVLRIITKRPWIADFRDPWFKFLVPQRQYRLPQKIDALMGAAVVHKADRIIAVCKGVKRELVEHFGVQLGEKIEIITNGYSQKNFDAITQQAHKDKFTISYIGSIYHRYDFRAFLAALDRLYNQDSKFRQSFTMQIVGSVDSISRQWFENADCCSQIFMLGYMSYFQALTVMKASSLLVLYIMDNERGKNIPTSKLYEYIGSGRPILVLAPEDSDAAEILRDVGGSVIIPPNDTDAIYGALASLFQKWQQKLPEMSAESNTKRKKYEMRALTQQLVGIFDQQTQRARP